MPINAAVECNNWRQEAAASWQSGPVVIFFIDFGVCVKVALGCALSKTSRARGLDACIEVCAEFQGTECGSIRHSVG